MHSWIVVATTVVQDTDANMPPRWHGTIRRCTTIPVLCRVPYHNQKLHFTTPWLPIEVTGMPATEGHIREGLLGYPRRRRQRRNFTPRLLLLVFKSGADSETRLTRDSTTRLPAPVAIHPSRREHNVDISRYNWKFGVIQAFARIIKLPLKTILFHAIWFKGGL